MYWKNLAEPTLSFKLWYMACQWLTKKLCWGFLYLLFWYGTVGVLLYLCFSVRPGPTIEWSTWFSALRRCEVLIRRYCAILRLWPIPSPFLAPCWMWWLPLLDRPRVWPGVFLTRVFIQKIRVFTMKPVKCFLKALCTYCSLSPTKST